MTAGAAGVPARHTVRIGLTGPIGCGKSTVASWLEALGATVIDADVEARAATAPGGPAFEPVIARFGEAYRAPGGGLDRAALGRLVFTDVAALADLEAIVHPAVRTRIMAALAAAERAGAPAVAVEAIKLAEGGLAALCDEVWLVTCGPEAQRARLGARGMAAEDARRRVAAQGDLQARLAPAATRILRTDGDPADARRRVEAAYAQALRGASRG